MCRPSKAHMAAAKHLLRYLAKMVDFAITYKQDSKLRVFSDANWGINPDNGKATPSYIIIFSNASVNFKVGLKKLTTQPTMGADLTAATLTRKYVVLCG